MQPTACKCPFVLSSVSKATQARRASEGHSRQPVSLAGASGLSEVIKRVFKQSLAFLLAVCIFSGIANRDRPAAQSVRAS